MIKTQDITLRISDFWNEMLVGARVVVKLEGVGVSKAGMVAPGRREYRTDADGRLVMSLWRNDAELSDTYYEISCYHPSTQKKVIDQVEFVVGEQDAYLSDVVMLAAERPRNISERRLAEVSATATEFAEKIAEVERTQAQTVDNIEEMRALTQQSKTAAGAAQDAAVTVGDLREFVADNRESVSALQRDTADLHEAVVEKHGEVAQYERDVKAYVAACTRLEDSAKQSNKSALQVATDLEDYGQRTLSNVGNIGARVDRTAADIKLYAESVSRDKGVIDEDKKRIAEVLALFLAARTASEETAQQIALAQAAIDDSLAQAESFSKSATEGARRVSDAETEVDKDKRLVSEQAAAIKEDSDAAGGSATAAGRSAEAAGEIQRLIEQMKLGWDAQLIVFNEKVLEIQNNYNVSVSSVDEQTGAVNLSGQYLGLEATAEKAKKLALPRTIRVMGDARGEANFDGSADVELEMTIEWPNVDDVTFESLMDKPTSLAGYGIKDAAKDDHVHSDYASSDALAEVSDKVAAMAEAPADEVTFAALTEKPTDLAGYGIEDAAGKEHGHNDYASNEDLALVAKRVVSIEEAPAPTVRFDSIESKPNSLAGYGIEDAAAEEHDHSDYAKEITLTEVSERVKTIEEAPADEMTFAALKEKPASLAGYGIEDAADKAHDHSDYASSEALALVEDKVNSIADSPGGAAAAGKYRRGIGRPGLLEQLGDFRVIALPEITAPSNAPGVASSIKTIKLLDNWMNMGAGVGAFTGFIYIYQSHPIPNEIVYSILRVGVGFTISKQHEANHILQFDPEIELVSASVVSNNHGKFHLNIKLVSGAKAVVVIETLNHGIKIFGYDEPGANDETFGQHGKSVVFKTLSNQQLTLE